MGEKPGKETPYLRCSDAGHPLLGLLQLWGLYSPPLHFSISINSSTLLTVIVKQTKKNFRCF
jgi:hypothetical protein